MIANGFVRIRRSHPGLQISLRDERTSRSPSRTLTRYQQFESISLQRRVHREPGFRDQTGALTSRSAQGEVSENRRAGPHWSSLDEDEKVSPAVTTCQFPVAVTRLGQFLPSFASSFFS